MDYEAICKHVGQLFLETRLEIDRLYQKNVELEKQRDNLLQLVGKSKDNHDGASRT